MAVHATVRLDPKAVQRLLSSPDGPVGRELTKRAIRVLNEAKLLCPVDDGHLRRSLTWELREGQTLVARVGTNVKYAIFVHEGTGIYGPKRRPIKPVSKKVLAWPIKGSTPRTRSRGGSRTMKPVAYAYASEVKGVPPRPFLRNALRAAR